jgi:hypothetical protein
MLGTVMTDKETMQILDTSLAEELAETMSSDGEPDDGTDRRARHDLYLDGVGGHGRGRNISCSRNARS